MRPFWVRDGNGLQPTANAMTRHRIPRAADKDSSPQLLHTVRGIGYMISADG